MSKFICPIHGDNPNWTCFESNGGVTHINGDIKQIESTPRIDINAFMKAVLDDIDIGIVIVNDYDLISYGTIKQLAEKHLGWVNENKI